MSPEPIPPRLITPRKAVEAATRVVNDLRKSPLWESTLSGASPAEPAILVRRIDLADSYYFCVPCVGPRRLAARVLIDGLSGMLVEIGAVNTAARSLRKWVTSQEAVSVVLANASSIYGPRTLAPFPLRREALTVPSVLSWKPCTESTSRFLPFYALSDGDRIAYVRVDGKFYARLTHDVRG